MQENNIEHNDLPLARYNYVSLGFLIVASTEYGPAGRQGAADVNSGWGYRDTHTESNKKHSRLSWGSD